MKPFLNNQSRPAKAAWMLGGVVVIATGVLAWTRVGLLNLPSVPAGLTLEESGLANLDSLKKLDNFVSFFANLDQISQENLEKNGEFSPITLDSAREIRAGIAEIERGNAEIGLNRMREGLRKEPNNLVFANAYRMVVFQLRREFLKTAKQSASLVPEFPPHLDGQPISFFEPLDRTHSTRETKLHLALAWVDHMLLFPALEIKAPSSVEAVDILDKIIDGGDAGYVPALFARGMNHLHRPARLVWPESNKTAKDAAAQDIGRCIAIGQHFKVGSPRLRAKLAIALGDAYVKADKNEVARSWWQIAQNLASQSDDDLQSAIRRRYGWRNEEIVDRLEEELDRARSSLDEPMTDLAFMWN